MTIDWKPIETFKQPKRRRDFLFWQPATTISGGRIALEARPIVDWGPPLSRAATHWAEIEPPPSAEEARRARLLAALREIGVGNLYLENFFWGPRKAAARARVLSTLTGEKVPQAKAGFNAFRAALYVAVGVGGFSGTANAWENEFARRAAAILEGREPAP